MKQPQYAKLLIRDNECFRIARIHYATNQVTLQESEKVYNTVSIKNVAFDFSVPGSIRFLATYPFILSSNISTIKITSAATKVIILFAVN